MHKKKPALLFILSLFIISFNAHGSAYEIKVKLNNYKFDKVFLAYYYGGKTYVKDTALVKNGVAIFKGDKKLDKGMYLFAGEQTKDYALFLVDDEQQQISVELDLRVADEMKITGSKASEDLVAYQKELAERKLEIEAFTLLLQNADEQKKKSVQEQIDRTDNWVKQYQKEYINKNPGSLLSLMIKANLPYEPPAFSGSEEEKKTKGYQWHKAHWFDNIAMADPRMLRTNILLDKIDFYIDKMTVQEADSIILSVDEVLDRVKKSQETYKFMLIEFLNKYARSKIVGQDAVYVHIALKYYAKGEANWIKEDELKRISDNAKRLEPLLIGKKAPDLELVTLAGEKTKLSDFAATYTILFFWDTGCDYCKKSLPPLIEAEKQFRDKGVRVYTVCTNTGTGAAEACREFVGKNNMLAFQNTLDINSRSDFRSKYDLKDTWAIFILDKNKVIRSKRISTDHLKKVLEYLLNKK